MCEAVEVAFHSERARARGRSDDRALWTLFSARQPARVDSCARRESCIRIVCVEIRIVRTVVCRSLGAWKVCHAPIYPARRSSRAARRRRRVPRPRTPRSVDAVAAAAMAAPAGPPRRCPPPARPRGRRAAGLDVATIVERRRRSSSGAAGSVTVTFHHSAPARPRRRDGRGAFPVPARCWRRRGRRVCRGLMRDLGIRPRCATSARRSSWAPRSRSRPAPTEPSTSWSRPRSRSRPTARCGA